MSTLVVLADGVTGSSAMAPIAGLTSPSALITWWTSWVV